MIPFMNYRLFFLTLFSTISLTLATPLLTEIKQRELLRVGTTFDYKPFTSKDNDKKTGFDIELASLLAKDLGVEVVFIQTTWQTLVSDLTSEKYDIGMSGITHTKEREQVVAFTPSYLEIGKSPLVRKEDQDRFTSLEYINQKGVRIGVNPGGTNATFVREHCHNAEIIVIQDNLSIPQLIVEKKVDVMITDNIEAVVSARKHPELCAINPSTPFTQSQLAYMTRKDDPAWTKWLTQWLSSTQQTKAYQTLYKKYLAF